MKIEPGCLQDGGISTTLLTPGLRAVGASASYNSLMHELISIGNAIVQADGSIAAGDKTAWSTVLAFCAVPANIDKIIKKA